jgi:general secretion pathway protein G
MSQKMSQRNKTGDRGFALIEMMVVISLILIMMGMAIPIYSHSITRAKEDNLRRNLDTLNQMIFQYTQDKQKAPESLDELKSAKYLTEIPNDITGSQTWVTEEADGSIMSLYQTDAGGIIGVHSGSNQTASDGTAYSSW